MKRISFARRILSAFLLALTVAFCIASLSSCSDGAGNAEEGKGFSVTVNGSEIEPDMDFDEVKRILGTDYRESQSSACPPFEGIERLCDFSALQITTYADDGKDYVMSVFLKDDSTNVSGVKIGSSVDEMTAALGDDYKESAGTYTYTAENGSTLICIVRDGSVASIKLVTGKADG